RTTSKSTIAATSISSIVPIMACISSSSRGRHGASPTFDSVRNRSSQGGACEIAVLVDAEVGAPDKEGRFVLERGTMEWHVLKALEQQLDGVCVVPFDPEIT